MDYSSYKLSDKIYNGSEKKIGIIINDDNYIIKFQKQSENGFLNNHICEHIGSNIFNILGEEAQNTILATYKNENVVLCKDFIRSGEEFVPFSEVGESSLDIDKHKYEYTYEDIINLLKNNNKLINIDDTIKRFWNMYIIDALIGNFDRHQSNWGFIKSNNIYRLAPIFDNGSSLFPRRNTDELMIEVLNDEKIIDLITYKYPTSQIRLRKNFKSSYYEIINSLKYEECNLALIRIYNKIDINKINKFIDNIELLTNIQKDFYKHIIKNRYEKIIKSSYLKLMEKENAK